VAGAELSQLLHDLVLQELGHYLLRLGRVEKYQRVNMFIAHPAALVLVIQHLPLARPVRDVNFVTILSGQDAHFSFLLCTGRLLSLHGPLSCLDVSLLDGLAPFLLFRQSCLN
jgi:hypothetical protein